MCSFMVVDGNETMNKILLGMYICLGQCKIIKSLNVDRTLFKLIINNHLPHANISMS